jgi:hypothetical protein
MIFTLAHSRLRAVALTMLFAPLWLPLLAFFYALTVFERIAWRRARAHARSTKLSTTRFSPALSN